MNQSVLVQKLEKKLVVVKREVTVSDDDGDGLSLVVTRRVSEKNANKKFKLGLVWLVGG